MSKAQEFLNFLIKQFKFLEKKKKKKTNNKQFANAFFFIRNGITKRILGTTIVCF